MVDAFAERMRIEFVGEQHGGQRVAAGVVVEANGGTGADGRAGALAGEVGQVAWGQPGQRDTAAVTITYQPLKRVEGGGRRAA